MARILRTSAKDGTSYNGFQWPSSGPVEVPDWDPTPECGQGLHGLLEGRGDISHLAWGDPDALWQIIEVDEFVDLDGDVKFPKGNVVYSGDREGALSLLAGKQTVREWVLEDPEWAYMYAIEVDCGPRDDTREAVLTDPEWAYFYALYVDEGPRDDTRAAALKGGSELAYEYALHVDKCGRDDTRAAVLKGGHHWAYNYARHVDRGPHEDTRAAVLSDPRLAYDYARDVDKAPRDDTREAVLKGDSPTLVYWYALHVDKKD